MYRAAFFVLTVLVGSSLSVPMPQYEEDYFGESQFQASEHAESIGNLLKNLPNILKKTADWIQGLGEIGDEIHPNVGSALRTGAAAVNNASSSVPDDLHIQVQGHLNKLVNITRVVKDNLNDTWNNIPELKESVQGLPGQDYILDVIESIPSSDYVDEQINEAINYFEPLAEAIGAQSNDTQVARK